MKQYEHEVLIFDMSGKIRYEWQERSSRHAR